MWNLTAFDQRFISGGPPILEELAWGAHAADAGRVTAPEPLFPRLDVEADATEPAPA